MAELIREQKIAVFEWAQQHFRRPFSFPDGDLA